jgi:hypothetical protein
MKKMGYQMKSLSVKLGVILMVVVIFYTYNSFAEIEIKYDRFTNKTTVRTDPKKTAGTAIQPALVLMGSYDGETPSKPGVCTLAFALNSSSWVYLRCHTINCLADGKPVVLPSSKHNGKVGKGFVFEFITIMVPFNIIEQLSNYQKVEFKICNTEFSISNYELEDLKTFVEAFKEKK